MSSLTAAWLAEVILISYRAAKRASSGSGTSGTQQVALPLPSEYAATFIVFGALGLLPDAASGFASVVGWGFVGATLLNLYSPLGGATSASIAPAGQQTAAGADVGPGVNIAAQ